VDMLSVPRLPLRLHSLAASRTGSKRLVREVEEDAEAGADIGACACAGTGELSPPPRDVGGERRGVVERSKLGSARSDGCEKRAGS
jgi:hypothetical protein